MERRDLVANSPKICACVALTGNSGMSRLHVCVDWIVLPLGNVMVIGLVAFCLFTTGAHLTRKCPVAPESEIA